MATGTGCHVPRPSEDHIKRPLALPIVSIFALGALSVAPAVADEAPAPTDPYAQQQAQYDRASAKYTELQAKYQEHKTKKNQKAKKAQAQRVEKAQARLDDCRAEPTESPEPTEG